MRPQRNAGEYARLALGSDRKESGFNEAPAKCRGILGARVRAHGGHRASMRPQRNAGEYFAESADADADAIASMRPQRNAGEYEGCYPDRGSVCPRFNEAPAKCRGIRRTWMNGSPLKLRFNEAPAKCRGIQNNGYRVRG